MSAIRTGIGVFTLAALLAACSTPTPEEELTKLKSVSATAIPGAQAEQIAISNQKKTLAAWAWSASYAGKTYSCSSDEMMRLPDCQATS